MSRFIDEVIDAFTARGVQVTSEQRVGLTRLHEESSFDVIGPDVPSGMPSWSPSNTGGFLNFLLRALGSTDPNQAAMALGAHWGPGPGGLIQVAFLGFHCGMVGLDVAAAALAGAIQDGRPITEEERDWLETAKASANALGEAVDRCIGPRGLSGRRLGSRRWSTRRSHTVRLSQRMSFGT